MFFQDELSPVESPAIMVLDIALRDRDFARLQTAQVTEEGEKQVESRCVENLFDRDHQISCIFLDFPMNLLDERWMFRTFEIHLGVFHQGHNSSLIFGPQDVRAGVVCVGDKAMIQVEEPISYPLNEAGSVHGQKYGDAG